MALIKMVDLNLTGKRVLIRSDLNVPVKDGKVISGARILASIPTIKFALQQRASVIVASHLGRPNEGEYNSNFSLQPIVDYLRKQISYPVYLVKDYLDGINFTKDKLIVLENVRFNKGEENNDELLAKKYAALCDVFVMDAFGVAHRAQSSTHGVGKFSSIACAGPLLLKELDALKTLLSNPDRPMIVVVGGSKVSTKLSLMHSMIKIADQIVVGGGIANTLIAAKGYSIGSSFYESNLIPEAKRLLCSDKVFLPLDVRVATNFSENAPATLRSIASIKENEHIMDLGDVSISHVISILKKAKTILWNGPVGVFEFINFRKSTEIIARAIANSEALSIAGGGDTLAAIDMFGIADQISYISTGGGSFLEVIEGKKLPVVVMLEERAKEQTCIKY